MSAAVCEPLIRMNQNLSYSVRNLCLALLLNALACGVIGQYSEREFQYLEALSAGICLFGPLPIWYFLFRKEGNRPSHSLLPLALTVSLLTYIFLLLPSRPDWINEREAHGIVTLGLAVLTVTKQIARRS